MDGYHGNTHSMWWWRAVVSVRTDLRVYGISPTIIESTYNTGIYYEMSKQPINVVTSKCVLNKTHGPIIIMLATTMSKVCTKQDTWTHNHDASRNDEYKRRKIAIQSVELIRCPASPRDKGLSAACAQGQAQVPDGPAPHQDPAVRAHGQVPAHIARPRAPIG